jgi:hypothetical protein
MLSSNASELLDHLQAPTPAALELPMANTSVPGVDAEQLNMPLQVADV